MQEPPCLLAMDEHQQLVVPLLLLLGSCSVPRLSRILQQNLLSLIFGQSFLCRFLKLRICTVLSDTLPDKYQLFEQISRTGLPAGFCLGSPILSCSRVNASRQKKIFLGFIYLLSLLRSQSCVGSSPTVENSYASQFYAWQKHDRESGIPMYLEAGVSVCGASIQHMGFVICQNTLFCFNCILFCFTVSIAQC